MSVSKDQLVAIMPNAKGRCDTYLPLLNKYMQDFKINTPLRVAHFLAQIAHESAELKCTEENLNYSAEALRATFPRYFSSAQAAVYARKPQKIGSRVYANRMGNGSEASGDGYKYRGRGFLQITGKANYATYKAFCGYDVVANPDLLAKPLGACRSACWWWQTHGLNELADKDDLRTITRTINGGFNGLQDREKYLKRAKKVILS